MKVLLLTTRPQLLVPALEAAGDTYEVSMAEPSTWPEADFIVSFGYRHVISEPYLTDYEDRLINIHQSILPWNRGADPNFWSWFDHTPKGVSIHLLDEGIDTGDVLMQMEISKWRKQETLKSSYEFLNECAGQLFSLEWPRFRRQSWFTIEPLGGGTYHTTLDKTPWMRKLPLGWDTPVTDVEKLNDQTH